MELISHWLAGFIYFVGEQTRSFWENLTLLNFSYQQIFLDIFLVSIIFYYIFSLLKGSRAVNMLIGLSVIASLYVLSRLFQLVTLGWLLDRFLTLTLVAIPIIFQQELRMGLERIGNTKWFQNHNNRQIEKMVMSIVAACEYLAKEKQGALIVVEHTVPLKEYADTGITLDAKVSKELLISIFDHHGPLHDGAVIISGQSLKAASCILPHSYKTNLPLMGTRHKAALGLSETTDASIVVVSEERGTISFARTGNMEKNISSSQLHEMLVRALNPPKNKKKSSKNLRTK